LEQEKLYWIDIMNDKERLLKSIFGDNKDKTEEDYKKITDDMNIVEIKELIRYAQNVVDIWERKNNI
jgi:hypothetical protein